MSASVKPEIRTLYETGLVPDDCPSFHEGQSIRMADNRRELALMRRIKAGDSDTKQQLIISSMLHVLRSNKHHVRNGTGVFELLNAGKRGLAHALENFEPEGKDSFSSYASMCIRQHIEQVLDPRPSAPRPQRD